MATTDELTMDDGYQVLQLETCWNITLGILTFSNPFAGIGTSRGLKRHEIFPCVLWNEQRNSARSCVGVFLRVASNVGDACK